MGFVHTMVPLFYVILCMYNAFSKAAIVVPGKFDGDPLAHWMGSEKA